MARSLLLVWCRRYVATTMVSFQLSFPPGYSPPACAPDCLISLSCGQAGLHPSQEGYGFSTSATPEISADGTYPLTLYVSSWCKVALWVQKPLHHMDSSKGPQMWMRSRDIPIW